MSKLRDQLRKARRRYRLKPTNTHLRWYLNAKARLGLWDHRMHSYYNVPTNVNKHVKAFIVRGWRHGLVPTATTNGTHAIHSMHYSGDAADLGSRRGDKNPTRRKQRFQEAEYSAWRKGKRRSMVELIGPNNNAVVLGGQHSPLAEHSSLEDAHDNHVHGGFSR